MVISANDETFNSAREEIANIINIPLRRKRTHLNNSELLKDFRKKAQSEVNEFTIFLTWFRRGRWTQSQGS